MDNAIIPASTLAITNMKYAEEQYGDFVDIHGPVLTIAEFQKRRNLPLNEQISSVFYSKTAHLSDNDFVEIDRSVLEMIGFKNTVYEVKDKDGSVKLDKNGNPKLKDVRADFSQAVRCLRNTAGFIEGSSFDDIDAHFVIQKLGKILSLPSSHVQNGGQKLGNPGIFPSSQAQHGGQNKQSLWIRMRALEHFIIMANTCNSFKIREYFLDLKRIMIEYNTYQMVYRSKSQLCIKDATIDNLRKDIHTLIDKSDIQTQKLEMLSNLLLKETDNKVIDVEEKQKKQELVVLRNKNEPTQIEVLRGQLNHVNQQLKRKRNEMEVVGKIDTYKNPINLLNRFNESIKKGGDERFYKSNNKIFLKNGSTADDLMDVLRALDEDKHVVAHKVKKCL